MVLWKLYVTKSIPGTSQRDQLGSALFCHQVARVDYFPSAKYFQFHLIIYNWLRVGVWVLLLGLFRASLVIFELRKNIYDFAISFSQDGPSEYS